MTNEIQDSIRAYHALSQEKSFKEVKNLKDAFRAIEVWERQYQMDDVTGESYLPADHFSNFSLYLAGMYKEESQRSIQNAFNKLYDLIQGTQENNLFEKPNNTPRTLAQAIKEVLNLDYNGQHGDPVLAGDHTAGKRGKRGSQRDHTTGKRSQNGDGTTDSTRRTEDNSRESGSTSIVEENAERTAEAVERDNDEQRQANRRGVADDTAKGILGIGNRGDIRVFEKGLVASRREHSDDSERTRRQAESERLVSIAKQHRLFIPAEVIKTLTGKVGKRTGESVVYIDRESGKVTKVKDPYAKSAMKSGVQPEDAAFEHLVHNLLFPETAYTLEGISEEIGDVRIVLSQNYIPTYRQPTKEQITEALAARGLFPEDNYSFGNELVSVTDVEGDNALLGEDGTVYFIDPIIRFKKPLREIISTLSRSEVLNDSR